MHARSTICHSYGLTYNPATTRNVRPGRRLRPNARLCPIPAIPAMAMRNALFLMTMISPIIININCKGFCQKW